jgi:hypothetical protein
MAISATEVVGLDSTSNTSSYTTGSGNITASRYLFACVQISEASGVAPAINNANVTGWGLTWTPILAWVYDVTSVTHGLFLFGAATGATSGAGTWGTGTLSSGAATGCQISIVQVDGYDTSEPYETTNVQDDPASADTSGTALSVTMNAFGDAQNTYLVLFGTDLSTTVTPGDTVTTLHDQVIATPAQRFAVFLGPAGDNTPTATAGSSTIWGGIAVEVKIAAGAPTAQLLSTVVAGI